ncbi:MAG: ROK family protein [Deltaproteobacteria bacterium]|jgi:polyphosphate glucokinase|nr:ROK family protein [Deltaproteobacteria bacterium]MCW8892133.1 ROK family protein [Deltaproteobacteria bacterium]MCW9050420.1 ROK family protein [Deltaproteobacteria bacterium]
MQVLGIDVGGSGIKGAIVDVSSGQLCSEPVSLITPQPATPPAVIETVGELVRSFKWTGLVGCGFPAVIQNGLAKTAANIAASWINVDVKRCLESQTGCSSAVLNDADAAGLAEMSFGAGHGFNGTVLVLTLGTGIGSALFYQGQLFPNLELGFLPLNGSPAEQYTSAAVRTKQKLSWLGWSKRLNQFLTHVDRLFSPELIIIGGGVSFNHEKFFPYLDLQAQLLPAQFKNQAGIVGAACFAANQIAL